MNSSVVQKQALDYVKNHNIDVLMKEMLNTAVHDTKHKPIYSMINYLSQFVNSDDLEKEGIKLNKSESEEKKFNPLIRNFYFPENSSLIIKRFLTPNVYDKLKLVKTKFGGHISHIIDAALKVDNKETVGIFATDADCYKKMGPLISPALDFLHAYDKEKSLFNCSLSNGVQEPKGTKGKSLLNYIKIRISRNLKNYPYLPHALPHTRSVVKDKILSYLQSEYKNGEFIDLTNPDFDSLNDFYFDKELNLISAGLVKENCGIFLANESKDIKNNKGELSSNLVFLINFNDHLQIINYTNEYQVLKPYEEIIKISEKMEKALEFDYQEDIGYLTTCPTNAGQGLKISAYLKIPKVINNGNTPLLFNRWSLRSKRVDTSDSEVYEILSKCKLKVEPLKFLNSFIIKVNSLINFENKLNSEVNFTMKKHNQLSSSTQGVYDYFYDHYKLVSCENKDTYFFFNEQFPIANSGSVPICPTEIVPTCYDSLHTYRSFFNDYITGQTGINMLDLHKDIENREKLVQFYNETSAFSGHSSDDISIKFKIFRNFSDLDFFNSKTDSNNLVSKEIFDKIATHLEKSVGKATIKDNSISFDDKTFIYLATEQSTSHTEGNHVLIESKDLQLAEKIEKSISEVAEYLFDSVFGYIARDTLFCGSGISSEININNKEGKNVKEIAEKHDFKIIKETEKEVSLINLYSLSLSRAKLIQKIESLVNEFKSEENK